MPVSVTPGLTTEQQFVCNYLEITPQQLKLLFELMGRQAEADGLKSA